MTVQPGLCRTWSEPKLLVFSCTGSIIYFVTQQLFVSDANPDDALPPDLTPEGQLVGNDQTGTILIVLSSHF